MSLGAPEIVLLVVMGTVVGFMAGHWLGFRDGCKDTRNLLAKAGLLDDIIEQLKVKISNGGGQG